MLRPLSGAGIVSAHSRDTTVILTKQTAVINALALTLLNATDFPTQILNISTIFLCRQLGGQRRTWFQNGGGADRTKLVPDIKWCDRWNFHPNFYGLYCCY